MRIIISPAKKMRFDEEAPILSLPSHLEKTNILMAYLKSLDFASLKALWKCSDRLVQDNLEKMATMDLKNHLSAALFTYDGLVFKHIGANVMPEDALDYLFSHLRILSAFYGVLKPFDGITSYRLEMQAKAKVNSTHSLYDFWEDLLYKDVIDESHTIINLASKEYAKCIADYLQEGDRLIEIVFGEVKNDKLVTKATKAKMARGEMVRFLAMHHIEDIESLKTFHELGFHFDKTLSTPEKFVFIS